VVGKLLAAVIAVLYVAGTTTLLLGGVVPEYRTAAGEELSGRVLADAAGSVERAVPDSDAAVDGRLRTDLPATIRDAGYALALQNGTLALDHPENRLDARTNLSLPPSVHTVDSRWESGEVLVVRVSGDGTNRTVALEER
jgi:hypothetical protein